jgi:hypothetical protein
VKRLLSVIALGALAVGASGCDLSPPAATVNGASISQSALNAELSTVIKSTSAQCALQLQSGSTVGAVGVGTDGDGTTANAVSTAFAANALETLVLEKLEDQTLAKHGVTVSAKDLAAATTDYEGQLAGQLTQAQQNNTTPSGCTLSATTSVARQLPAGFLARQATSLAAQEAFEVTVGHVNLSPTALQAYYQSHLTQVTQLCLNLVVSDTAAGAQRLHDEIAAGTTFTAASTSADVDQQVSPTGGRLPCEYPSQITQLFASTAPTVSALADGQLTTPLTFATTSSTGTATNLYLVVQMRSHHLVPFATLSNSIREAILGAHTSVVGSSLRRIVSTSDVAVDPRYGSWSVKNGVSVPTPPNPAFVLNATANQPPASGGGGFHLNLPTG